MVLFALVMISDNCWSPVNKVKVEYTGLLHAACVNAWPKYFAASIRVSSGEENVTVV